jgi:hypothetical protein
LRPDHPPLSERNLRVVAAAVAAGTSIHVVPSSPAEAQVFAIAMRGARETSPAPAQAPTVRPREHNSPGRSPSPSPPSTGDPPKPEPARGRLPDARTTIRWRTVREGPARRVHAKLDAQLDDALADDEGWHR